jgi:hypothetical protein
MPSYDLTFDVLQAYARRQFTDRVGTKADTEIEQSLNDALAMVAKERRWVWYLTPGAISTKASYSTGTITMTADSTTVTLSVGTFPTYAASGELAVNGQWYDIATRNSGTQLTLTTAYPGATGTFTAGNWLVYQDGYDLPTDCMNFHKPLYGRTATWKPTPTSYEAWLEIKTDWLYSQQGASHFCVRKNQIMLTPAPSDARVLNFCYYRKPAVISASGESADWDSMHVDVLFRALDHQLSLRGPCQAGNPAQTLAAYKHAVTLASANEKQETARPSPLGSTGGYNRDPSIPSGA